MPKNFKNGLNIKFKDSGFNKLIKNSKLLNKRKINVGFFEEDGARSDGNKTNPELAFKHEFGSISSGLPARSILRGTFLGDNEYVKNIGKDIKNNKALLDDVDVSSNIIGENAKTALDVTFQTEGHGTWTPLSPKTSARKGHDNILLDKGELSTSHKFKIEKL